MFFLYVACFSLRAAQVRVVVHSHTARTDVMRALSAAPLDLPANISTPSFSHKSLTLISNFPHYHSHSHSTLTIVVF